MVKSELAKYMGTSPRTMYSLPVSYPGRPLSEFPLPKEIKGEQKKGSFQICFAFFAVCSLKITMLTLYIASSLNRSHLSPFWDYFWFYVSCYRGNKMVGLILGFRGSAPCGGVIFPQEINVYHALCIKILFNNTPGKPFWSNIKKNYWF